MVVIVDYDTGNLCSVRNALSRLGADYCVTDNLEAIRGASHVLMPGVGEASSAMAKLRERHLDTLLPSLAQPVLGICIGMQLMCLGSEEGEASCLSIFHTQVRRLLPNGETGVKVPHMGWNDVEALSTPLFMGVEEGSFFYFVHSFAADICDETIALSSHGRPFSAALHRGNFYGVQFHPEKSGALGEKILSNFLQL